MSLFLDEFVFVIYFKLSNFQVVKWTALCLTELMLGLYNYAVIFLV